MAQDVKTGNRNLLLSPRLSESVVPYGKSSSISEQMSAAVADNVRLVKRSRLSHKLPIALVYADCRQGLIISIARGLPGGLLRRDGYLMQALSSIDNVNRRARY